MQTGLCFMVAERNVIEGQPRSDQGLPQPVRCWSWCCRGFSSSAPPCCCGRQLAVVAGEPFRGSACIWCWMIPEREDRDAAAAAGPGGNSAWRSCARCPSRLRMPSSGTVQAGPRRQRRSQA